MIPAVIQHAARLLAAALCCACMTSSIAAAAATAADCGGLSRLDVNTPPGFCVGIVASGFKFPRGIQPLPNGDLLVVDMGGWEPDRGSVWRLKQAGVAYEKTLLLTGLDRPSGIALGPDGLVYIGAVKRIFRFDPARPAATLRDVIGGASKVAPLPGLGRHLLTTMRFDPRGDLFVNVGSSSDHCESADGSVPAAQACREAEGKEPLGAIRRYSMAWPGGTVAGWESYARGLRNSMALAFQPRSGVLWQGENGRDSMQLAMPGLTNDEELPHDELNLIKRGANYGWPYCYDANLPSPEYPAWNCKRYQAPLRLLPAHAAPLGMTFYTATRFPALYRNSLLIGFHGYRRHGHRLVALLPDAGGAPLGKMVNLISGWEHRGTQPMGAPVDIQLGPDGNIYISEDRNGRVLRLQYH
jgi:glucose/arabinose dehydrogenase